MVPPPAIWDGSVSVLHVAADDRHTDHLHQQPGQHLWLPGGPVGHCDGHHTHRPGHQFAGPVRLPPSRCTGEICRQLYRQRDGQ